MTCTKFRHATEADARRHLRQLKASSHENKKQRTRLAIYFCVACGSLHVGHNKYRGKQFHGSTKSRRKMRSAHRVATTKVAGASNG